MKSSFLPILFSMLCSTIFSYSQPNQANTLDNMGILIPGRNYNVKSSTEGSPYLNKLFVHSKVGDVIKNAMMRYNAYNDEFEFINAANDTLVLNKTAAVGVISITNTNTNYELVNYTDKNGKINDGYLVKLYEKNNLKLHKRQKINYYEAKPSTSSYDTGSPARFVLAKDAFFLSNKDSGIIEISFNKKGLVKLFPEKKAEIESFIKQNDIDFDKQEDKNKIIDFLAQ